MFEVGDRVRFKGVRGNPDVPLEDGTIEGRMVRAGDKGTVVEEELSPHYYGLTVNFDHLNHQEDSWFGADKNGWLVSPEEIEKIYETFMG